MNLEQTSRQRHYCTIADELRMRSYAVFPGSKTDPSWLTREPEEPDPCAHCQAAQKRRDASAEGRVEPFYVVACGTVRLWGGPEEGGWWYDALTILEVRRAFTWREGLRHARELRQEHPTCPRGRGSVLGGEGVSIHVCYEEKLFPKETTGRPRYE